MTKKNKPEMQLAPIASTPIAQYYEEAEEITTLKPTIFVRNFNADAAIERFMEEEDINRSSLTTYGRILKIFFKWAKETNRDVYFLTIADIKRWKEELFVNGKTSLSVAGYLTALRKFYSWMEANNYGVNITRGIKTPKREQTFIKQHLNAEESAKFLTHFIADDEQDKSTALRDYAIANLLIRCGLRTIEAIRANVGDITRRNGKCLMWIQGKGHSTKDRFIMLSEKVYKPIKDYLATRENVRQNDPLFVSSSHRNNGERLTTRTISGICKKGLRAIGLDDPAYSAHSLRHTTAVMILLYGGTPEDAQQVLRHSNPATTQIYTKTIEEDRRLTRFAEKLIDNAF